MMSDRPEQFLKIFIDLEALDSYSFLLFRESYEIQVEERTEEYKHLLQMMIPAYKKKGCDAFLSRGEYCTGKCPTSFPDENTSMPYSGFEPEPTRLQTEGHNHHTG
ncbi:hypothetical protein TNCV_4645541 [Trichonephila clavipes]|nr:hypothetical protein TNCV_4645541 [Trichonephila clavipes]